MCQDRSLRVMKCAAWCAACIAYRESGQYPLFAPNRFDRSPNVVFNVCNSPIANCTRTFCQVVNIVFTFSADESQSALDLLRRIWL